MGMGAIQARTFSLASTLYQRLKAWRHYNGAPVCVMYSQSDFADPSAQVGPLNLGAHISLFPTSMKRRDLNACLGAYYCIQLLSKRR